MSRRPSRGWRLPSTVLLLLHAVMVGAVPLADARLADGAEAGAHVEPVESPSCPLAHDHLLCQLCRQMGPRLVLTPGAPAPAAAILTGPERPEPHCSPEGPRRLRGLGPRAPPLA